MGGSGLTGSLVGDTGSSRGITVYRFRGCPIWATTDLLRWSVKAKSCARKSHPVNLDPGMPIYGSCQFAIGAKLLVDKGGSR